MEHKTARAEGREEAERRGRASPVSLPGSTGPTMWVCIRPKCNYMELGDEHAPFGDGSCDRHPGPLQRDVSAAW